MRIISSAHVARPREDECVDFWSVNTCVTPGSGRTQDPFRLSAPKAGNSCDFFISHCWNPPEDWGEFFSKKRFDSYPYKKAQELSNKLFDMSRARSEGSKDKTVDSMQYACWVDKACIPQDDLELKIRCIMRIEGFLCLSEGLIVLVSWNYFQRLWCIYEIACFLVAHH